MGLALLCVSWLIDPPLVLFFMLALPLWAFVGFTVGLIEYERWAGRVTAVIALVVLAGFLRVMGAHTQWYMAQAAEELDVLMTSHAAGRPSSRFTVRQLFPGLEPARRQQLFAAYAVGECTRRMQDEWFGTQIIVTRCSDGTVFNASMREQPAGRWSIDLYLQAPEPR